MVKNIIFDLGGVLYRIDYQRSFIELSKVMQRQLTTDNWSDWFRNIVDAYDTGKINTETMLWHLQRYSSGQVPTPYQLIRAWNAMLIDWEEEVFEMLERLGSNYNLYLLSNINELHYGYLRDSLKEMGGIDTFNKYFQSAYYSHLIGLKKPHPETFEFVLQENQLDPAKTIFIDDFAENVAAARSVGLHAVQHNSYDRIKNMIFSYLNLVS